MSEELLLRHGAPTLAGLKTGNLFSCTYQNKESIFKKIRKLSMQLSKKGIEIAMMRVSKKRILIYIYRPRELKKDLSHPLAKQILKKQGYEWGNNDSLKKKIFLLKKKLRSTSGFPHEIGLFLGYPPEDVDGFIKNNGCGSKCVGCWKVYEDESMAKKLFEAYKVCTCTYINKWKMGFSIEELAISSI